ncbi:MAG: ATP-binding protein [Terrimicrobiaceae bacterium]
MNWVTVVWTGATSASLMLAAIHGFVWLRKRSAWASLMFCLMAASTAGMAGCELAMMRIDNTPQLESVLQWYNIFRWAVSICLVGFMHFYLRAGRPWLELTVIGLRTFALLLNLFVSPNAYFSSIEGLNRVMFLGQMVTVVEGVPNPLMLVGQVSLLVLAAYLVDTTWKAYSAGAYNRALRVGSGSVFFVLALSLQTMLVLWGVLEVPIMASLFFLGIVGVMAFELSEDMLRATRLAENLQQREIDLNRERKLTDAIFQGAPGLLFLQTKSGTILRWNKRPTNPSEIVETKIHDFFRKEDLNVLQESVEKTFEDGAANFELDLVLSDGETARHFFSTVQIEIGEEPHLVGVGIDVSAEHALGLELALQKEKLARVSQIASMSELSSSLAHEINQPLAIILSNAEAAQRQLELEAPNKNELKDILKDIVAADIRAADVIRRLRSILQRGQPALETVSPSTLINNVLQLLKTNLDSSGALVSKKIPKRIPILMADRIPIEQVLINLIKNALEAMEENGARGKSLIISCAAEGTGVRFSIRDNGSGLPESGEWIFEAFHTTKPTGLGLGLKICQTIVQAHGGRLWAEPNKGRGATFHFHLPTRPEST